MFVIAMNLTAISPMLIEISREFRLTSVLSGFIFTVEFAGFITFILLGGILADRYGKKTTVLAALAGILISVIAFSLSGSFYTLCISMFFMGGFGGVIESIVTALVSDMNPVNNSFYVNFTQVFFGLGALAGPVMAGYIISYWSSWRIFYYILGGLFFITAVIFASCKITGIPKSEKIRIYHLKKLASNRKFILVCLCMLFYTGSEVGGWGWMSTFLKDNMGFSIVKSGIAVAVFWAALTVGRFILGFFTGRFRLADIILFLTLSSSAATLLSAAVSGEFLVWLAIVLMGLTYSSQFPLMASYGSKLTDVPSGTVFSLLMGGGALGSMVVPLIMGVLGQSFSLRAAMLLPAALLFAAGIVFIAFRRNPEEATQ